MRRRTAARGPGFVFRADPALADRCGAWPGGTVLARSTLNRRGTRARPLATRSAGDVARRPRCQGGDHAAKICAGNQGARSWPMPLDSTHGRDVVGSPGRALGDRRVRGWRACGCGSASSVGDAQCGGPDAPPADANEADTWTVSSTRRGSESTCETDARRDSKKGRADRGTPGRCATSVAVASAARCSRGADLQRRADGRGTREVPSDGQRPADA